MIFDRVLLAFALCAVVPAYASDCRVGGGERVPPVLELYTSEGCSSCPPADRWLSSRFPPGTRRDVIVLAFHVDYWNRLGWEDRFATAAASARQSQAARANRATFVYTPQMLLQGRDFTGWRRGDIDAALATASARPARAQLALDATVAAGEIAAVADVKTPAPRAELLVALVDSGHATDVRAGENQGVRLRHDHVVRAFEVRPLEPGVATVRTTLTRPTHAGTHPMLVALVQDRQRGEVLQAVAMPLAGCGR